MTNPDWGSVPQWLAAVGTVGTLLRLVGVHRQSAGEKRRAQASLFNVWPSKWEPAPGGRCVITVSNRSDAPVYRVGVELLEWNRRDRVAGRAFLVVDPGSTKNHDVFRLTEAPPDDAGVGETIPPLRVDFTDAAGHVWRRDPDGRLSEMK